MNNLETIKKAWAMGWSATVKINKEYQITGIHGDKISTRENDYTSHCNHKNIEDFEILGYKYAGELAGNEPIPEGTRFIRAGGEIVKAIGLLEPSHELDTENENGYKFVYPRRELTPIFND